MERFMMHKQIGWLLWLLVVPVGAAVAQAQGGVLLTVRLRAGDGTAVTGERVVLQRLPEETPVPPDCETNTDGECSWTVRRGLYQVLFTQPLDDISAQAAAEGGLRGLGITVGDENIVYHFTFYRDGRGDSRVYFDAAPDDPVPSPLIPAADALHSGAAPASASPFAVDGPAAETPTPEPTRSPEPAAAASSGNAYRVLLFMAGGLVLGGSFHLLRLRARLRAELARRLPKGEARSKKRLKKDREAPHA